MTSSWNRGLGYFLLLAFVVSGCGSSCGGSPRGPALKANSEYQQNWQKFSLQGKVKSLRETHETPPAPGSWPETLEQLWFDPAGNVTRHVTTGAEGYYREDRYKLDGVGNAEEVEHYNADNTLKYTTRNTFDADGNIVEYFELTQGTRLTYKVTRTYVKYTPEEHVIEWRRVVPPSSPDDMMKYVIRFDAQGRKTQQEFYADPSAEVVSEKTLYQYKPDNTVEETAYHYRRNTGRVGFVKVVLRDAAHRVLSTKGVDEDRPADSVDESFQYDAAGNILEYTRKTTTGVDVERSYRNEYEYDSAGNWTRRVTSSPNRELRRSVVRHLEYYPAAAAP